MKGGGIGREGAHLEDVEADAADAVHVGVIYFSQEANLRGACEKEKGKGKERV